MKYLSIDIQTTGLDPETCQILQIGAIIEDTENLVDFDQVPKLNLIITHRELSGSIKALSMNSGLISILDEYHDGKALSKYPDILFVKPEYAVDSIVNFLLSNGFSFNGSSRIVINAAGKNFGTFDKRFLEKLPKWNDRIQVRNRIIDPAILFVDWKSDSSLPSLNQCKQRAGISGEVSHDAIEDAWDVIQTLRTQYKN